MIIPCLLVLSCGLKVVDSAVAPASLLNEAPAVSTTVTFSVIIEHRMHKVFHHTRGQGGSQRRKARKLAYSRSSVLEPFDTSKVLLEMQPRHLDEYYYSRGVDDNEQCAEYLVSFLEGTTDAHDTCEGIANAYTAAECSASDYTYNERNDYDDYFNEFSEHQCCQALMEFHAEYCEENSILSNFHLLVAAVVLLLCEVAKFAVTKMKLHFLPEAATCILVGTFCGLSFNLVPGVHINNISFDSELFLTVLLPPIIFEAALSVSKHEFKRRRGAIFTFSVFGTVLSTFTTGLMVHFVSMATPLTFPMLDSLVFGALISSIDPVAILSVLTDLHLDQKDTIFILVFGESLLNDGIAITVFQTLVARFDGKTNDGSTSVDEILDAFATFLQAMFGSIFVGVVCGFCALWYFSFLEHHIPPVMEVGSFLLWAIIPYYICDGVGWSGIVSIVVVGFFMDIYIAGPKNQVSQQHQTETLNSTEHHDVYVDMQTLPHAKSGEMSIYSFEPLQSTERIHLSATANRHIRFVAHLTAQLAENALFAYLGLFLFSSNYDWDPALISISIVSCVASRALMVVVVSAVITRVYKHQRRVSRTAISIAQPKTQFVLVLAGLRGAVSLALVENVPIYNNVTEEGCEFKQLMKGMTSGCILFTTFVFGCAAFFILPRLGITPDPKNAGDSLGSPRDSLASPRTIPEGDEGEEEKPSIEII